jgi:uncharacterized membrane protein
MSFRFVEWLNQIGTYSSLIKLLWALFGVDFCLSAASFGKMKHQSPDF